MWGEKPLGNKGVIFMQIFTQKPCWPFSGWAVKPSLDSHHSLPLWIYGLVCGHCPSLSMCESPLLAGFWAGFGFYSGGWYGLELFSQGSSEESLGAWGKAEAVLHLLRAERGLVCSHFCSGRGAAVSRRGRPECVIHGPEACLLASGAGLGLPWELLLGSWMHT